METERKEGWLKTRLIIEVAGFPKEHIEQTIVLLGEKFGEGVPEIKVTSRKVREPHQISEESKIWTGFIEFEADIKDVPTLIGIIFDYMPSSVEIIEPEELVTQMPDLNGILNDLATRLHQYDSTVKLLKAEIVTLKKKLKELASGAKSSDLSPKKENKG